MPAMACPWFRPESIAPAEARPHVARAPLGALFTGTCHARPASSFTPTPDLLFEPCNFGYGRGRCSAFPQDGTAADAVRLSGDIWVLEANYAPVQHGPLDKPPSEEIAAQISAWKSTRHG